MSINYLMLMWLLISASFPLSQTTNHCGNEMRWQLQSGQSGRTERAVRLYDNVDGSAIGRLAAGSQFEVLEGPHCGTEGRSWWWVRVADGFEGWAFEGADNLYQLLPLRSIATPEEAIIQDECPNNSPPRIEIGRYATLLYPIVLSRQGDRFVPLDDSIDLNSFINADVLVLHGPQCLNNARLWQIMPPPEIPDGNTELWIVEANEDGVHAFPSDHAPSAIQYHLPETRLFAPRSADAAPLINVNVQLGYSGGGGGGDEGNPACSLTYWNSMAPGCVQQSFPQDVQQVEVEIIRPDGVVYSNLTYNLTSTLGNFIRIDVPERDNARDFGGVWMIRYRFLDQVLERAYYVALPFREGVYLECDGVQPVVQFYSYTEDPILTLTLNRRTAETTFVRYDTLGEWEVVVATDGSAQIRYDFVLPESEDAFFSVEEHFNWNTVSGDSFPYFFPCPAFDNAMDALAAPLTDNVLIMGIREQGERAFYALGLRERETVSVEASAVSRGARPIWEIRDLEGTLMFRGVYGEVGEFSPPETGDYVLSVFDESSGDAFSYIVTVSRN